MHARSSALIFGAFCATFIFAPVPARVDAAAHAHHRHHAAVDAIKPARHHKHASGDEATATPSHHHRSRQSALLAELREQNEELYQLRHERNVFSARTKHLAVLVRLQKAARSRHARKHASASLNDQQTTHRERLAAVHKESRTAARVHAAHLALAAQHEKLHEERLAAIQERVAKAHALRLAHIAAQEARREQHPDHPSGAVNLATGSGLPIWQGDFYAAQVPVKVVMVDLNDSRIRVSALLARNGIGTSEPFTHMISRSHPNVAVTGTFFSLDNLRPVGDIVINGNLAYFGGMGTALAITPGNRADMITLPWGHHHNWSGYQTVVACGPRLLEDGEVVLDPHAEHFKDRHMLAPNSRIAVGITGHNQLVFCMTRDPIYLGRLAKVMHSLGCKQAMNLDAGTSTGFYVNGHLLARPGRWLTNAIVVYSNHKRFDSEGDESASGGTTLPLRIAAIGSVRRPVASIVAHRAQQ